jgi:PTH2 family peptidyl-tRNA hydrolase
MAKKEDTLTMILVTRKDLKLSRGKLAAQCGHAAVECALKAKRECPKKLENWRQNGARKIVVEAPSLDSLKRLFGEAQAAGIVSYMVRDAGHTEIPSGTVTVVGLGPGSRREIDQLTGGFSLVN